MPRQKGLDYREERFRAWLRKEMDRQNLGVMALGELAGTSGATISRILNGVHVPSTTTINKIATAMGLDATALYDMLEHPAHERDSVLRLIEHELRKLDEATFALVTEQIRALIEIAWLHRGSDLSA